MPLFHLFFLHLFNISLPFCHLLLHLQTMHFIFLFNPYTCHSFTSIPQSWPLWSFHPSHLLYRFLYPFLPLLQTSLQLDLYFSFSILWLRSSAFFTSPVGMQTSCPHLWSSFFFPNINPHFKPPYIFLPAIRPLWSFLPDFVLPHLPPPASLPPLLVPDLHPPCDHPSRVEAICSCRRTKCILAPNARQDVCIYACVCQFICVCVKVWPHIPLWVSVKNWECCIFMPLRMEYHFYLLWNYLLGVSHQWWIAA